MRLRQCITAVILGAMLLGLCGCGASGPLPQPPNPPAKQSMLISSQGLQEWRILFTPDLKFNVQYLGHPMFSNAVLTLFTRPSHGDHWHRFYTTGQGLVEYREWSGGPIHGENFVGQAKLVVTWMIGKKSHEGYAVYRIRDVKQ